MTEPSSHSSLDAGRALGAPALESGCSASFLFFGVTLWRRRGGAVERHIAQLGAANLGIERRHDG